MKTSIMIVDDHTIFRQGLKSLIQKDGQFNIVAEAESARQSLKLVETCSPEIVLMDIYLGEDYGGINAARYIKEKRPDIKVVILTMYSHISLIKEALLADVDGFVVKEELFEEVKTAMEYAVEGKMYLSYPIIENIVADYTNIISSSFASNFNGKLTAREKEIMRLLKFDYSNRKIADFLNIDPKTVSNHKNAIKKKLDVYSEKGLIEIAKDLV